ncbi:hypothetical protein Tco_1040967 [Tanacetum coccineum]|uniref:Uncharacterized protein n=1 Tax=Tanacetum coccineum TaxID=301880 RepID=A0ABQ5GH83_9ASTR
MSTEVHQAAEIVTTSNELDLLFGPLFDEYFNGENQVVLKSSAVTTTDASNKRQQQPDSTSSTSTLATTVTANGNFDLILCFSWEPCQGDSLNSTDQQDMRWLLQAHSSDVGYINTFSYQAFQVIVFNIKIVDSNLPHHQRASKSNKESSIGSDC